VVVADRGAIKPVLWHIGISHYSEKVRWALAYKGVEHERRAPGAGAHIAVALWLTRGARKTFPVLALDGRNVGDSTAIIAALEERYPDPPLYPADPDERARALALEEFFDEELGAHIRLLVWHETVADAPALERVSGPMVPKPLRRLANPIASAYLRLRFGVQDPAAAELARSKVLAALDRLEAELGGGDYLVGDSFTVADLTAASLFYPLVGPPEGPRLPDPPERIERFRAPLEQRRGYRWVGEMFARHRKPST
jgi:glutathione S-transferase